jgi:hypothetical protein
MAVVQLYRFDANLHIVEKGVITLQDALVLLHECQDAARSSYESGEEAMAATSFGLTRTESDFLEVSCNGPDQVGFHTDFIHAAVVQTSFWKRLFNRQNSIDWECDDTLAERVVADYFQLARLDFETKYSNP